MAVACPMPGLKSRDTLAQRDTAWNRTASPLILRLSNRDTSAGRNARRGASASSLSHPLVKCDDMPGDPVLEDSSASIGATPRLDREVALAALKALRSLPPDWSGRGAVQIERRVLRAAEDFILYLPSDIIATPEIVPMTRGRLQFEWHQGNRSLEIELESEQLLHYLKWDSDAHIEEEDVISVHDTDTIQGLLRWFAAGSLNA